MVAFFFPIPLYSFEIRATLLSLQHDFCALWNEIVLEARNSGYDSAPGVILRTIRHLHLELHQGTDHARSRYALCDNPGHRPGETAHTPGSILATPLPPIKPAYTSPHLSDTPSSGDLTHAPQLAFTPVSQEIHTISATSQHIASTSAAPLHNESITTPPSMVPGSLSSASLIPVTSSALTGDLRSPVDSTVNQSGCPPRVLASSSSSPTADPSCIAPQAASFSDHSVSRNITVLRIHDDILATNVPTLGGEEHDPSENLA
ncbi:hypothetical protein BJV78DRAFT_209148 [Lactifluus subvellereus]|nr:hypothetical protein BJV78DRAFT_209148 [Lactifluus subvellereus]